jgi:hypothetical protein
MYLFDVLNHCGRFCEVITRDGKVFGVLARLSATAFLIRAQRGVDEVVDARDIVSVKPLRDPHF